jgi:hypothetical protein
VGTLKTELREPNFSIDLPGDWEQIGGDEPEALVFRDLDSERTLSVLLLGVRPLYAIADQERLLADYMSHRAKFEAGQRPRSTDPVSAYHQEGEDMVGGWWIVDLENGRRFRHHVILTGGLLADFRYEAVLEEDVFQAETDAVFATASATAEPESVE